MIEETTKILIEYGGLVMVLFMGNLAQGYYNLRLTKRLNELVDGNNIRHDALVERVIGVIENNSRIIQELLDNVRS